MLQANFIGISESSRPRILAGAALLYVTPPLDAFPSVHITRADSDSREPTANLQEELCTLYTLTCIYDVSSVF